MWPEFEEKSPWGSANSLKESYLKIYQSIYPHLEVRKIPWDGFQDEKLWSSLKSENFQQVILPDMRFDLALWLPLFCKHFANLQGLQIHLYGNPLTRLKRLRDSGIDLSGIPLLFVTGTQAQEDMLKKVFNNSQNLCYLPFIPQGRMDFNPSLRQKWRKEQGISDEKAFFYAGRISYQKNVHHLLDIFSQYAATNPHTKLFIAGAPDNLNWREVPRANYLNYAGELFFEKLSHHIAHGSPIVYLGRLDHSTLTGAYSGCDHYLSLSTFNGEDFGVSIAEALSSGMNCSLTDWCGHKEFAELKNVALSPVDVRAKTLGFDSEHFLQSLTRSSLNRQDQCQSYLEWRDRRQKICLEKLSELKMKAFGGFQSTFIASGTNQISGEFFETDKDFLSSYWS